MLLFSYFLLIYVPVWAWNSKNLILEELHFFQICGKHSWYRILLNFSRALSSNVTLWTLQTFLQVKFLILSPLTDVNCFTATSCCRITFRHSDCLRYILLWKLSSFHHKPIMIRYQLRASISRSDYYRSIVYLRLSSNNSILCSSFYSRSVYEKSISTK